MKYLPPPLINRVHQMDALELMRLLPAKSVDAIITDLPYGTTACSWDEIIPFAPMWAGVKRILKPRGVFVTTASQPFTSKLVISNLAWFRSEWIWNKVRGVGYQIANVRQLMQHENVVVFGYPSINFYPQMQPRLEPKRYSKPTHSSLLTQTPSAQNIEWRYEYFPTSLLTISNADNSNVLHPTQKPVALYEYLIKTYTQPGELVLDFCCGSGTTAVAARNLKRNYIVGDTSAEYCAIACERLKTEFASRKLGGDTDLSDLPMFRGEKLYRPAGKAS